MLRACSCGFNGAALNRGRKDGEATTGMRDIVWLQRGRPQSRAERATIRNRPGSSSCTASTGPPSIEGGKCLTVLVRPVEIRFNGAALNRGRKGDPGLVCDGGTCAASTGPPSIEGGKVRPRWPTDPRWSLQRGRPQSRAERPCLKSRTGSKTAKLQRGRPQSRAERGNDATALEDSRHASTGPPSIEGGKPGTNGARGGGGMLQRGRPQSRAESMNSLATLDALDVASTGPPSIEGGKKPGRVAAVRVSVASTGPPSIEGGKALIRAFLTWIFGASTGPPSIEGGKPRSGSGRAGERLASTGPPSIEGGKREALSV
ncbi:Periplasmic thiol disulfide interchange protein DsbA [Enhygromyxa salina]|uniref:Periplasmic thiol disulfide interchange protein DsbA n=1 Tax=Enhygromyxa salina TaxID=215803 RepID=A0A0C2A6C5_9BACT|nr:Periplasmic thiol disulfide interchange protein DsbA [Enhygromyxa salina]